MIENLTVRNGRTTAAAPVFRGGGIRNEGNLTPRKVTVSGNQTATHGGGITSSNPGTFLFLDRVTVTNKTANSTVASTFGGGVFTNFSTVRIRRSTFTANQAIATVGARFQRYSGYVDGLIDHEFSTGTSENFVYPTGTASGYYPASIGGRILTPNGSGIRGAIVVLTGGSLPAPVFSQTNNFGYNRLPDVPVGQTYVMTVNSKRYAFSNSTRIVNLQENLTDLDIVSDAP